MGCSHGKPKDLGSISRTYIKNVGHGGRFGIPAVGRRQADFWGPLASQPSLCGEFQDNENGRCLRSKTQGCSQDPHICVQMCVYTSTQRCTPTHEHVSLHTHKASHHQYHCRKALPRYSVSKGCSCLVLSHIRRRAIIHGRLLKAE